MVNTLLLATYKKDIKFWSIAKNKFRDSTMGVLGNDLTVIDSSPNNQQIIVLAAGNFYITFYFVKYCRRNMISDVMIIPWYHIFELRKKTVYTHTFEGDLNWTKEEMIDMKTIFF